MKRGTPSHPKTAALAEHRNAYNGRWNCTTRAEWANEKRRWFVYVLADSGAQQIRYIGLTCNPAARERSHAIYPSGTTEKNAWARRLVEGGAPPKLIVIDSFFGTERGARERERVWIRRGQRIGLPLFNER